MYSGGTARFALKKSTLGTRGMMPRNAAWLSVSTRATQSGSRASAPFAMFCAVNGAVSALAVRMVPGAGGSAAK